MKNFILLIALALSINANAQMNMTGHSTILMEQFEDGAPFELEIVILENGDDEMIGYTLTDGVDYIYSQTFQFNFSPHPEQLKTLSEYGMAQHITTQDGYGNLLFVYYADVFKYVTIKYTSESSGTNDYIIIEAMNLQTDVKSKYKYKITGFIDHAETNN